MPKLPVPVVTAGRGARLAPRLTAGLTAVLVVSLVILVGVMDLVARGSQLATMRRESAAVADLLARLLGPALLRRDLDGAAHIAESFAADPRVTQIVVRDRASQASRRIVMRQTADTVLLRRVITSGTRELGEVDLAFDRSAYAQEIVRLVRIAVLLSLGVLLAAVVVMRRMLGHLLQRPLQELSALATRYAAGDYDADAPVVGSGELRDFSEVLQGLGRRVTAQLGELRRTNKRLASEVAARQDTAAALRLQSAAMQAVANAVLITDRAGVVVWVNEAFTALTGFRLAEAMGKTPGALIKSGRHDAAFYARMWRVISERQVWNGEIFNRRRDGTSFTADMTITPLTDESGAITHFIAVQQDITARKELEEQFRQSQKMESVGRLAGGVAHDFNNMLSVILGNVELAMLQVEQSHPLYADLDEIHNAAQRSADLTRQLLAFARKQDVAPTVIDVNAVVSDSLKLLRRLIGEHVNLVWRPGAETSPVFMDPSQLAQLLANLCVNARDAIVDVGTISLSTANVTLDDAACAGRAGAVAGDYVRLTISDTGAGMSAEVLVHIFEPFFTTKGIGEGTGLGLATVYGVVAQNHGFVEVRSEVQHGTTFEIFLPRHAGTPRAAEVSDPTRRARGHETILLVEDEPMILNLTTRALEGLGYTVLAAAGPGEALGIVEAGGASIDLLVTDLIMPGMNGKELVKAVRALRPTVEHLYMSGFAGSMVDAHGVLDDDAHFLAKPFTQGALAAKVRALLSKRGARAPGERRSAPEPSGAT